MLECQLVPWDLVRHLLAKWCLVIVVKEDGIADGTCCPREGAAKGGGHEKMHFVTLSFTECGFDVFTLDNDPSDVGGIGWIHLYATYSK